MAIGYLMIETATANGLQMLANCNITITKPDSSFRYTTTTQANGRTGILELETVDRRYSLSQQTAVVPFIRYHIEAAKAGYNRSTFYTADIFDGIESVLQVHMMPAHSQLDMPANIEQMQKTQYHETLSDRHRSESETEVSLTPVISIPPVITIKLGAPNSNSIAIQLPYLEYIKRVVSRLVYPTWPEELIKTAIYAASSNALQRLATDHYRQLGFSFDITADGVFDQPFSYRQDIPFVISRLVDLQFSEYLISDNGELMQFQFDPYYLDHQNNDTQQNQEDSNSFHLHMEFWSLLLPAIEGETALAMLRDRYGPNTQVVKCQSFKGILPYPMKRLRCGDYSAEVALMKQKLHLIAVQFPFISDVLLINTLYDEATSEAVQAVQELSLLPSSGSIDEPTWYRISYLAKDIMKLHQLLEAIDAVHNEWVFPGELRIGSYGPDVYDLQLMINLASLFHDEVIPVLMNSRLQKATEGSIKAFQQIYQLPMSGIVDQITWNHLHQTYLRNHVVLMRPNQIQHESWPLTAEDSSAILYAQKCLNEISWNGKLCVAQHGHYDETTQRQIELFQLAHNISATKIIDEMTGKAIIAQYVMSNPMHPWPASVLGQPMNRDFAALIQRQLNVCAKVYRTVPEVEADGILGSETIAAIRMFQRLFGLPIDGRMDQPTWNMLMLVAQRNEQQESNDWLYPFMLSYLMDREGRNAH